MKNQEDANLSRFYTLTVNRLSLAMDGTVEWQLMRQDEDLKARTATLTRLSIPETDSAKKAKEMVRDLHPEVALFGKWIPTSSGDGFEEYRTETVYA